MFLKKRFGFTLAEVLITLVIIGVIAALTIPTLMQEYRKTVTETGLKKANAMIAGTIQKMMFDESLPSLGAMQGDQGLTMFNRYFAPYFKISQVCEGATSACSGGEQVKLYLPNGSWSNGYYQSYVLLDNGMLLSPWMFSDTCSNPSADYGCIVIDVDINGLKPPNRIGVDSFYISYFSDGTLNLHQRGGSRTISQLSGGCKAGGAADMVLLTSCTTWIASNGFKIPDDYPWL